MTNILDLSKIDDPTLQVNLVDEYKKDKGLVRWVLKLSVSVIVVVGAVSLYVAFFDLNNPRSDLAVELVKVITTGLLSYTAGFMSRGS